MRPPSCDYLELLEAAVVERGAGRVGRGAGGTRRGCDGTATAWGRSGDTSSGLGGDRGRGALSLRGFQVAVVDLETGGPSLAGRGPAGTWPGWRRSPLRLGRRSAG